MKKYQWSKALAVLLFTGCVLTPLKLHAEAEPLYVLGLDLDYMEPNYFLSWVEEMKYRLSEVSPLMRNIIDPNGNLSDG